MFGSKKFFQDLDQIVVQRILTAVFFVATYLFFSAILYVVLTYTNDSTTPAELPSVISDTDYAALGDYFFNQGPHADGTYDRELARKFYTLAILDGDDNDHLWYNLGRTNFIDGNSELAINQMYKQIELHGDIVPNIYYTLGLTYAFKARRTNQTEDWEAGARYFSTFLEYEPNSPWARVDLAWIYFSLGRFQDMLPVIEVGLESHPDHPWLLNMYGVALINNQRYQEALISLQEAEKYVAAVTVDDWGQAYPGNDPDDWPQGLTEFKQAIDENLSLADRLLANSQPITN